MIRDVGGVESEGREIEKILSEWRSTFSPSQLLGGNMCMKCGNPDFDLVDDAVDKIRRHGLCISGVGGDTRDKSVSFTYTAGLTARGLPELIMWGKKPRAAAPVIQMVASGLFHGADYGCGSVISNILTGGQNIALMHVGDSSSMLITREIYTVFDALQVVWPDARGRFPWDVRYSLDRTRQPISGHRQWS